MKKFDSRLVGTNDVTLEKFSDDKCKACYACPTHVIRSSIHPIMQHNTLLRTHPLFNQTEMNAPTHTIIVEANMRSSEHHAAKIKLNKVLRQRILTTCGNANCM